MCWLQAQSPRQEAPTVLPGEACAFSMHLCRGVGEEACGVCRVLGEMEETRGCSQPGPGRGCWCSAPASAIPSGRGAAGTQIVLVVPSPLPSEVTPSLSQSPPSLRGEPLLGGQSTYGSPTQGPPALLLKLLGGGSPPKSLHPDFRSTRPQPGLPGKEESEPLGVLCAWRTAGAPSVGP